MATLVGIARTKGVSGYRREMALSRWLATHRLDVRGRVFRLALEKAPAGSVLHAVAEEGVAIRQVAEVIAMASPAPGRFGSPRGCGRATPGFLAPFIGTDAPVEAG